MRSVVLIDLKIDKDEALAILDDYREWYEEQTGIKCDFYVERRDFSVVPTIADSDGDLKPTHAYRQGIADEIHSRYGDYGVDNIITWPHEDNFFYRGVWGTAWSYVHHKYNYLLCRWDKDNPVNTWNTLFHEGEHPADTLIRKELGIDINPLIEAWLRQEYKNDKVAIAYLEANGFDYDRDYVHGNAPMFEYIGRRTYQRDARMLKFLAPYLRAAYQSRKDKHMKRVGMMQKIVSLLSTLIGLLSKKVK